MRRVGVGRRKHRTWAAAIQFFSADCERIGRGVSPFAAAAARGVRAAHDAHEVGYMQNQRELTLLAVVLGVLIGVLFGAANAYIGLKVGMTVSASIPAAVISMAVLRGLLKRGTILENNMVQTIGSVGESLAAGMIFTIPALFVFAYSEKNPAMAPTFWEIAVYGAIGGLLGVLFMIPLRRMLIVKEHGKLPYPEGTACAEVLEAGQIGGVSAKTVFMGLGVGAAYEFFRGLGFWAETVRQRLPLIKSEFQLSAEPALLGVGYILGIRVAGYMLAGAVLGWFVIIPAIAFFGAGATTPLFPELKHVIADMSPGDMWNRYLRYIGAGAVVLGGIVSLLKSFGVIGGSLFHMFGGKSTGQRTDRDIPTILLLLMIAGLAAAMWYLPTVSFDGVPQLMDPLFRNATVIACVLVFGFFFTTVSSRLVGIVGGSSNPASGMTIATLLGTALIIVYSTELDPTVAKVAIISVGAMVCMCICMAGDTAQDLKPGLLVGETPWKQQVGQLIGVLTATAALAWVLLQINSRYGYSNEFGDHPNAVLAPQANLMKLLVQGVVDAQLPWELILIGMAAALIVELLGLPSLPFAVGLYLPLGLSTPIMVGGVIHWLIEGRRKSADEHAAHKPGLLAASGLVAGQGLVGVAFIGVAVFIGWVWNEPRFVVPKYNETAKVWAAFDASKDTWAYQDAERSFYWDAAAGEWREGSAPVPASQPTQPRGELVVAKHFYPWLTTKFDFLEMEYGLRQHALERGAFKGAYLIDWWNWLPLVPWGAMAIWLALIARRPTPPPEPPRDAIRQRLHEPPSTPSSTPSPGSSDAPPPVSIE
ncbi:MAG: oligopeptide transporter, OPT family [Planctomycetota bacterium]|nr:MAG: oligopeptide transporter, OPT family [Planctomycetota bacterium]